MIDTVTLVESSQLVPYRNQAIEEYLLNRVRGTEMILYLWQNDKTVVIGRNQNAWKECNCSLLEADGGFLARRISGGGAVYHDKGNLNFTFAAAKENYDVSRQMNVILAAVKSFGIHAECSGRNDVTVDGRKFSGNAYYDNGTNCMHHGTLLLTSSAESIEKYLTVSKAKLEAKGVDSVKSRVTVLSEYVPTITIATMKAALVKAAQEVFCVQTVEKQNVEKLRAGGQNTKTVDEYEQKFSSWNWRYGKKIPFTCEDSKRFSWGEVNVQLAVSEGVITDAVVWSDALDVLLVQKIAEQLKNVRYVRSDVQQAMWCLKHDFVNYKEFHLYVQMIDDISTLVENMI
jgi:lipoate-protein ligase A